MSRAVRRSAVPRGWRRGAPVGPLAALVVAIAALAMGAQVARAQDPVTAAPAPEAAPGTVATEPVAGPPPSPLAPPTSKSSWAGRLLVVTTARATPSPAGKGLRLLQPIAPLGAGSAWFQVRGVKDVDGVRWVKVLVPHRPNGSVAWVRADDMQFRRLRARVVVDLSDRSLSVFRRGRRIASFPVAVGAPATPTPHGRFALAEVIHTGDPSGFLGPIVMPLTAFSNALNEYAGGNGRVAIHGTSQPSLIGQAVSHGCIRMRNADISRLSRWVRPGVSVIVRD